MVEEEVNLSVIKGKSFFLHSIPPLILSDTGLAGKLGEPLISGFRIQTFPKHVILEDLETLF